MPHLPESSYTRYRLSTGLLLSSLILSYGIVGLGSSTAAAEPEPATDALAAPNAAAPEAQPSLPSTANEPAAAFSFGAPTGSPLRLNSINVLPADLAAAPARQEASSAPLLAQVWPGSLAPSQPVPALAQVPLVGAAPAGMPIPWQVAPPLTVAQAAQPAGAPAATPAGTWVMVWLPYGMPYPGMPEAGGNPMTGAPTPYGMVYPAWVPMMPSTAMPGTPGAVSAWPTAIAPSTAYSPAGVTPWAVPPAATAAPAYPQPQPSYPYGQAPGYYPYGQVPGAFGYFPGSVPAPVYPQPIPNQLPFNTGATASFSQPSTVPTLTVPTAPTVNVGAVPPPPAQPIPIIPPAAQPTPVPPGIAPAIPAGTIPGPAPATIAPATAQSLEAATQAGANAFAGPLAPQETLAFTQTNLNVEGLYVLQGDRSSARARLNAATFLTPNVLVGGTLDVVTGPDLTSNDGIQLTELYLAASIPDAPGLRFRLGQLDLTSYFDRNSFAKDIGRDFFNPIFNTNPALLAGANVTASRPGGLVQWAVSDDITLSASAFSSAPGISDFALDGFAGELSFRTGNLILRGTYLTSRDTQFQGTQDRLSAYGVNAEWFIPEANIGLFGRYGRLNNTNTGFATDTYSLGLNALDLFMENDRLGLAYGRNLSTASVNGLTPDALEVFYDFEVLPNIRIGFTFQQLNQFSESVAGFRIRSGLDLSPSLSLD
ncbi:MAG: hypothetical protein ICV77_11875 [Cyanobacteria bacterium Co-bin8]|nr:hypothetical protein [Cyanobacteria bacterium Co-bin8]